MNNYTPSSQAGCYNDMIAGATPISPTLEAATCQIPIDYGYMTDGGFLRGTGVEVARAIVS